MQKETSTERITSSLDRGKSSPEILLGVPREALIALFLIFFTLFVYYPVAGYDYIDLDDDAYTFQNEQVRKGISLEGVQWAFRTFEMANWHPLTWLSYMTDVTLFGLHPGTFHLVNVAYHLATTLLIFLLLRQTTGAVWRSAFVAALFAVHPLHVESVAWISERKDVLSTFFWMLCMLVYVRYTKHRNLGMFCGAALLFILGLAAKPMLVTLPIVLFLFDYWPLGRFPIDYHAKNGLLANPVSIKCLVLEKIPLLIISTALGLVTLAAQKSFMAVQTLEMLPMVTRVANALVSYTGYLVKMAWPVSLTVLYPYPDYIPVTHAVSSFFFIAALTTLAIIWRHRAPYLIFGWFWYLITLLPVIGLVQAGNQAMADRYTYVPLIGIFVMISWGVPDLFYRWQVSRKALAIIALASLSALALTTRHQLHYWQDSVILFRHTIAVTGDNYLVQNNLGVGYEKQGRLHAAAEHYREALRIRPGFSVARFNLGNVYQQLGQLDDAIEEYLLALESNPRNPETLNNLAKALVETGHITEGLAYFRQALEALPGDSGLLSNYAAALVNDGQYAEAIAVYEKVIRLQPGFARAHLHLGVIHERQGLLLKAGEYYDATLRLSPDNLQAQAGKQRIKAVLKGRQD